jgi:hypothetical protein
MNIDLSGRVKYAIDSTDESQSPHIITRML